MSHGFGLFGVQDSDCGSVTSGTAIATDGSGYTLTADGNPSATVTSTAGKILNAPLMSSTGPGTATDRNGNQITVNSSGVFTDTLGTTGLTVSGLGTPTSPLTFTYTAPSGASAAVKLNYSALSLQTAFACSGVAEYGPTTVNLVTSVTLPDDSPSNPDKYLITYEPTTGVTGKVTGRIASITLPTGGQITYAYTGGNNGVVCADGSAAGLTRTTPDGQWTYARTAGPGAAYTTTITDPQNNQTVIQFQGIYETQRQTYQGPIAPANLLQTVDTCYNGATVPCTGTAVSLPITQRSERITLPNGLICIHASTFNSFGLLTEQDDYDYGPSGSTPLMRRMTVAYASLGNNVHAFKQTVTVLDGGGNTISQTTYNYDQTAVTTTTGTPQHVSASGSRGNLTSVQYSVDATHTLTRNLTYYDTGMPKTATDGNGPQTTFNFSTGSCGNSFPTSLSLPLSLSRSFAWNCTGGVMTSLTDENGRFQLLYSG